MKPVLLLLLLMAGRVAAMDPAEEIKSLRLAIEDLGATFGTRYAQGDEFGKRLSQLERRMAEGDHGDEWSAALTMLRRDALLANPLLDFERLLLIQRDAKHLGLPQNWEGNSSLPRFPPSDPRAKCGRSSDPREDVLSGMWIWISTRAGCSSRCPETTAAGRFSKWRRMAASPNNSR
jgi:hypothetical protein